MNRLTALVLLPVAGAALSWVIGSAWWKALNGRETQATVILWTVLLLAVPVALLGQFMGRRTGPRWLGLAAGALTVLLVLLSFLTLLLLYPAT